MSSTQRRIRIRTRRWAQHIVAVVITLLAAGAVLTPSARAVHCPAGKYDNNGNCLPCPLGSVNEGTATGDSMCHGCGPGQVPNAAKTMCLKCPAGSYANPGAANPDLFCKKCAVGYSPNANQSGCTYTGCPGGTYLNTASSGGVCKPCPLGSISSPGGLSCQGCGFGQIPNSAQTACLTCPPNSYSNGNLQCQHCKVGSHVNDTHSGCVADFIYPLPGGGGSAPKPINCPRGAAPSADGRSCSAGAGTTPGLLDTPSALGAPGPAGAGAPLGGGTSGGGGARPGAAGTR